jgi:high-affinity nickel-transport protein
LSRSAAGAQPVAVRRRVTLLFAGLAAANIGAWAWALLAFHDYPALLGTAMIAYGFGLRHALDADHIAAIDNVTRKLMGDGQKPVGVGLFFSLGHSTVVIVASCGIAAAAGLLQGRMASVLSIGGVIGPLVSSVFLLAVAAMNVVILLSLLDTFRRLRAGEHVERAQLDAMLSGGGLLARLLRPLFRAVQSSWHMYPVGLLFGLGFDTATEVGLLGMSATQAAQGLSIWSILVFPALFTAGMSLVDSADSVLMLGVYGWGFVKPLRKIYYNMTITIVSIVAALLVSGIETLGLLGGQLDWHGGFWDAIGSLNDNFGLVGYVIVAVFVLAWLVSSLIYRARGYHRLEIGGT